MKSFFSETFGIKEPTQYGPAQDFFFAAVGGRDKLINNADPILRVDVPGRSEPRLLHCGQFDLLSLEQARRLVPPRTSESYWGRFVVNNVVGEARALHSHPRYRGAVVQAASQLNCLEFSNADALPEHGIACYEYDRTQGPACAMACAAGTAMRNYFVWRPRLEPPKGESVTSTATLVPVHFYGQTQSDQINCLSDCEQCVRRETGSKTAPWIVRNGYIDSTDQQLEVLNRLLATSPGFKERLMELMTIGVHSNTQVTNPDVIDAEPPWLCTQTYNSAISIGYSRTVQNKSLWEPFAMLVLEATYEISLLVAIDNAIRHARSHKGSTTISASLYYAASPEGGSPDLLPPPTTPPVLFTKVGGGVFQNRREWIFGAIKGALERCKDRIPPEITVYVDICHYGTVEEIYMPLAWEYRQTKPPPDTG